MTSFGFRIHSLEARLGRKRDDANLKIEDVSKAGGEPDAFKHMRADLLALKARGPQFGSPNFYVNEQTEGARDVARSKAKNLPYFIVSKVSVHEREIHLVIETGREADHDALVGRDGSRQEAREKAAVRKTRVILLFPTKGNMAFMVSEVRGQSYAGEELIKWLTRSAQREAVKVDADGERDDDPWLHWKVTARMGGDRLDGILGNASNLSLRLRRRTVDSAGARGSYDLEVTQWGLKKTPVDRLVTVFDKMSERRGSGAADARRKAAAADVVQLIDPDVSGVEFDDAAVSFLENGKRQTISSETVDRLFIYPLGDKRLKGKKFRSEVAPVLQGIAKSLGSSVTLDV